MIRKKIERFNAHAYHQGEFLEVSGKDLMGNWSILCFYSADFTFVCSTKLEDLQKRYSTLKFLGVRVFSYSTDAHFTHKAWHDTSDAISRIEYVMIGDPSHQISHIFDVLDEKQGLAQRGVFIIDSDGIVQAMGINVDEIDRDASTLIDKIRATQYVRTHPGEVCPARWKESGGTLKSGFGLVGKI